jgi:CheY-like chemotaxis protein
MTRPSTSLLYIEDDVLSRDIICSFIHARYPALTIYSAGTAEEGLEYFDTYRPSIVLTDINLSGSDGITFSRSVRSVVPTTVIVFITGSSEIERLAEFRNDGPSHVITKPVVCRDLFELLDRYLST